MNHPFFSVIITTYNRPEFILEAVESVLQQKFKDYELIIIDDGSVSDYSKLKTFVEDHQQVKFVRKQNEERSAARNYAVDLSKGEFICFLDDDDIYYEDHLLRFFKEIQVEQNAHQMFFKCGVMQNDGRGALNKLPLPEPEKITKTHNKDGNFELKNAKFNPGSVCIPKKILSEIKFNHALYNMEDVDLWLRINRKYPLKIVSAFTYEHRLHGENTVLGGEYAIRGKIKTLEHWLKHYKFIPRYMIIDDLKSSMIDLLNEIKKRNKLEAFYLLIKILKYKPTFLFKRQFFGELKEILR